MMVFKRKQIVVLSLIVMIVVAGYLQYTYNKTGSLPAWSKDNNKPGEAQYVDNADNDAEDVAAGAQSASKKDTDTKPSTTKEAEDFFAQARVQKDTSRSRLVDDLKKITEDVNAGEDSKSKAYDQIMKIKGYSEKESSIEILVKETGFSDAMAYIAEDGSIDVIVKSTNLTSQQTAKIVDIVMRQAQIQDLQKIHVKNVY